MAIYAITAVRINERSARVELARMGLVNTAKNEWASPLSEIPVIEVVDKIMHGDVVYALFPVNGKTVLGPELEVRVFPHGLEGIEVQDPLNNAGRTIVDLPRF